MKTIFGYRVIVNYEKGRRVFGSKKAEPIAYDLVAELNEKTGDCEGNWGGFGFGPFIVVVEA